MHDGVVLIFAGSLAAAALALNDDRTPAVRFGLVTDLHHAANATVAGSRDPRNRNDAVILS